MNASNLTVNADMRCRKSSKLKSTFGSWVRGLGCGDMGGAAREDAEAEKGFEGAREASAAAILSVRPD